jgi:DNA replication and repair protein RecF
MSNNADNIAGSDQDLCITSLILQNFRNYERYQLNNISGLTIFVGPNAVGKTSIIEAIQLITALRSFRCSQMNQVVHWNSNSARVQAHLLSAARSLDLSMIIKSGSRSYSLNGKKKTLHDLRGLLPAVVFCPDDLHLIKGSNGVRRDTLDSFAIQLSKNFDAVKKDYVTVLKQKNQALKDEVSADYIASINDIFIRVAAQLIYFRCIVLGNIQSLLNTLYREITSTNDKVSVWYQPGWVKYGVGSDVIINDEQLHSNHDHIIDDLVHNSLPSASQKESYLSYIREKLQHTINDSLPEERIRKRSCVGPHVDQILFTINGHDAMHYASQGQQRSLVLACKLSELTIMQSKLHQKPVLLLDDVMSELDENHRGALMEYISRDIQTFITTTTLDYFPQSIIQRADIIHLP